MNIGDPWPELDEAEMRVLAMQRKLHHWAKTDPGRRFDDLHNLVYDPSFLVVAWNRVRSNAGARTAGVDGIAPRSVGFGAAELLTGLRAQLKAGTFVPQRVREKTIPKASGKLRRLGIHVERASGSHRPAHQHAVSSRCSRSGFAGARPRGRVAYRAGLSGCPRAGQSRHA